MFVSHNEFLQIKKYFPFFTKTRNYREYWVYNWSKMLIEFLNDMEYLGFTKDSLRTHEWVIHSRCSKECLVKETRTRKKENDV